jgi:hypothetical protein
MFIPVCRDCNLLKHLVFEELFLVGDDKLCCLKHFACSSHASKIGRLVNQRRNNNELPPLGTEVPHLSSHSLLVLGSLSGATIYGIRIGLVLALDGSG